ncbi:MAG: TauD/TfdA family dioxygenase [Bauldia sp.]
MFQPPRVSVSPDVAKELVALSPELSLPGWDFESWPQSSGADAIHSHIVQRCISEVAAELQMHGFVVIGFSNILDSFSDGLAAGAITAFLARIAPPIRVFIDSPTFWRKVDVDLTRPPNRSRGTGFLPLHMDFVNAENPPDYVCLLSMRPDPRGGGNTIVASMDQIEKELPAHVCEVLRRSIFSDGAVVNLANIGEDANPFSVLADRVWRYRFTDNLLRLDLPPEVIDALNMFASVIQTRAVTFGLPRGDCVVIDQHRTLHGRMPLGSDQAALPPAERRLVLHAFLRERKLVRNEHVPIG